MPDEKDPRYEVEDDLMLHLLQTIGSRVAASMPPGIGFGLFIFNLGPEGAMFWISNSQRDDMMKALREFIAKEGAN